MRSATKGRSAMGSMLEEVVPFYDLLVELFGVPASFPSSQVIDGAPSTVRHLCYLFDDDDALASFERKLATRLLDDPALLVRAALFCGEMTMRRSAKTGWMLVYRPGLIINEVSLH